MTTASSLENDLLAARFAAHRLELTIANVILRASPAGREAVLDCVLKSYARWMKEAKECAKRDKTPGPKPPDCPPCWTPVGNRCIPPDPDTKCQEDPNPNG